MNTTEMYQELSSKYRNGYWSERILAEFEYLLKLGSYSTEESSALTEKALDTLYRRAKEQDAITREDCLSLEEMLAPLSPLVKQLKVLLIGHAHIDMNWMWGYQETSSLAIDTFTTVLKLMEEYPQFTFSQSQASVYSIVEEYYPAMLEEIRKRIAEGRWEVTASTWVENDKNMSSGEAMERHVLYTRDTLSKLLKVDPERLDIDFEPDTFGHSGNMPEILNSAGVKYYYHCRGFRREFIYRWRSRSGAELLCYREPVWYNDETAAYDSLAYVPAFCERYGLDTAMKFYGVGDHGGGPTRQEIEHWIDMQTWPLMPTMEFGTIHRYFDYLETRRDTFPVVDQELNYVFTGCYTTQARIKRANRLGEDRLADAEALDAEASLLVPGYRTPSPFERAWKKVLFNQFHDILPGSGVQDTIWYALGEFEKAMGTAQVNAKGAMRAVTAAIDTSSWADELGAQKHSGSGFGFMSDNSSDYQYELSGAVCENGRVVTVFNPTQYRRTEYVRTVVWDWDVDPDSVCAVDAKGNAVDVCVVQKDGKFWANRYFVLMLRADVGPFGYSTYLLRKKAAEPLRTNLDTLFDTPEREERVDHFTDEPLVLDNGKIRAVVRTSDMKIVSLRNADTGKEIISEPTGYFELVNENTDLGMTAWRVGKYSEITDLNDCCRTEFLGRKHTAAADEISYRIVFSRSSITVCWKAVKDETFLRLHVSADWHEVGTKETGVPQLRFVLPLGYSAATFRCAIPYGSIDRKPEQRDVPCTGWMCAVNSGAPEDSAALLSDCKYGFRGEENRISLSLLRSSFEPDLTPDQGQHEMTIAITAGSAETDVLEELSARLAHPLAVCSGSAHAGSLPADLSAVELQGSFRVTAFKKAEDGRGFIFRVVNPLAEQEKGSLVFADGAFGKIRAAEWDRGDEVKISDAVKTDGSVEIELPPYGVKTLRVVF